MTTIGQVIGWKFNHQQGMVTKAGVITKFPGGIPSQADQSTFHLSCPLLSFFLVDANGFNFIGLGSL